jgi:predicted transcriptional regulator
MSVSATLQELARQVRRDTLQILDAAQPTWLTYSPPGTSNHILWHAGHALWLQDVLCVKLLAGREELPARWAEKYGMDCRSVSQSVDWPSRDELRNLLGGQLRRLLKLLATAPDERLAETADPNRGTATISDRIIHGLHDEAKHTGEMYLILKLCRAGH